MPPQRVKLLRLAESSLLTNDRRVGNCGTGIDDGTVADSNKITDLCIVTNDGVIAD